MLAGARVIAAQCAESHKAGAKPAPIALTTVMNAPDAANLVEMVVHGIQPPPTGLPDRSMPNRALQVSDEELVTLAAFLRDRVSDAAPWTGVRELVVDRRLEL